MQYLYYSEGQFKQARNPVTGTKCRTGQLNHQFVEQQLINGIWTDIGGNDTVAGEGCRFREGVRIGDYVVDVELEVAGFLLAENDGWENIGGAVGNPMPSGLTLTLISGGVQIDWTDNTNGVAQTELWGQSDGAAYALLYTINAGITTKNDTCTPVDLRYYKIRSKRGSLYSPFTTPISIAMLGAELVTNGSFNTDSAWAKAGTTIGNGVAIFNGAGNISEQFIEQGKTYKTQYEALAYVSGGVRTQVGADLGLRRTANGVYIQDILATAASVSFYIAVAWEDGSFVGSIDNVSCKEVLFP